MAFFAVAWKAVWPREDTPFPQSRFLVCMWRRTVGPALAAPLCHRSEIVHAEPLARGLAHVQGRLSLH